MIQYFLVGNVGQSNFVQVVIKHKLIENIGAQHHGTWDGDDNIIIFIEQAFLFDERIQKSQATGFASDGTVANTGKTEVFVEAFAVELGDDAPRFIQPVVGNGIEKKTADFIQIGKIIGTEIPEEFG